MAAETPEDLLRFKNTTKIPLAILDECTIEPGKTGQITRGATQNPGVAVWIKDKWLVPDGATPTKEA